ncbi:hypothetical protein LXL04_019971 [Taraxacum kok-saghyz]
MFIVDPMPTIVIPYIPPRNNPYIYRRYSLYHLLEKLTAIIHPHCTHHRSTIAPFTTRRRTHHLYGNFQSWIPSIEAPIEDPNRPQVVFQRIEDRFINFNRRFGLILESVCATVLTWVMGQRYAETAQIMPAGVVAGRYQVKILDNFLLKINLWITRVRAVTVSIDNFVCCIGFPGLTS